ncbi:hypothetical protein N431DRAFT_320888 [Stipitochalara longipes BDJ]|nr:hypothetical protein N431DRAFT_320888 [Stipitochalara longipes BDJ]
METTGYEKLAHLMSTHQETAIFQRFGFLNTLNTLYLQAELVHLEQKMKEYLVRQFRAKSEESSLMGNESGTEVDDSIVHRREEQNNVEIINIADSSIRNAEVITNEDNIEAGTRVEGSTSSCVSSHTSTAGDLNIQAEPSTANADITRPSTTEDNATSSTNSSDSPPDPVKDWWDLAHAPENSEARAAWKTMLQARSKLKEYNSALLQQAKLLALPSPNTSDLTFLTHWLENPSTGNFPLIGKDWDVWSSSPKSSLAAISPRLGRDPLSTFFLKKAFIWWHRCVGSRLKKPVDEEAANYFVYNDKHLLRVADSIGSIVSSLFLIVSILVLYFVRNMLARLGVVAAFTVTFSFALVLVTIATKAEVFAGTAA